MVGFWESLSGGGRGESVVVGAVGRGGVEP